LLREKLVFQGRGEKRTSGRTSKKGRRQGKYAEGESELLSQTYSKPEERQEAWSRIEGHHIRRRGMHVREKKKKARL